MARTLERRSGSRGIEVGFVLRDAATAPGGREAGRRLMRRTDWAASARPRVAVSGHGASSCRAARTQTSVLVREDRPGYRIR